MCGVCRCESKLLKYFLILQKSPRPTTKTTKTCACPAISSKFILQKQEEDRLRTTNDDEGQDDDAEEGGDGDDDEEVCEDI